MNTSKNDNFNDEAFMPDSDDGEDGILELVNIEEKNEEDQNPRKKLLRSNQYQVLFKKVLINFQNMLKKI